MMIIVRAMGLTPNEMAVPIYLTLLPFWHWWAENFISLAYISAFLSWEKQREGERGTQF